MSNRGGSAATPLKLMHYNPRSVLQGVAPSHSVAGTSFVVDTFNATAQASGARHFFLTHFHADHYKGLGPRFTCGTVYCTRETAKLVRLKLRVRISDYGLADVQVRSPPNFIYFHNENVYVQNQSIPNIFSLFLITKTMVCIV